MTMPVRTSADSVEAAAYFPRADEDQDTRPDATPSSAPSQTQLPVFDEVNCRRPIMAWDEIARNINYTERLKANLSAEAPSQPTDFKDKYLYPMLAKNERLRLTMLWYYTRNITHDPELLRRLQEKINLVKDFMGWDFAIMGILSNDSYTRIAASGLPLGSLPRRESTCSHTINQEAGSVFWIDDMDNDWRFKDSPHVSIGGLRSYAGTQLRFRTNNDEDVSLGTLCIASNDAGTALIPSQKDALVRFAAMCTDEIINGARVARHRMRQHMVKLIAQITEKQDDAEIENVVLDTVKQVYPGCHVLFQTSGSGMIIVRGRGPFSYEAIPDGLWEDTEYLEGLIASHNHEHLVATQTVRVIVGRCAQFPVARYLVVDSMEVQNVFDDIDAWFVERCSLLLCNIIQKRFLEEALRAKETFLRGITHELRTPIHGVLASSELLAEELANRDVPFSSSTAIDEEQVFTSLQNARSILATINSSGKELMSTVNNILKLNRWAGIDAGNKRVELYKLDKLEDALYKDIVDTVPPSELDHVSIFFNNQLTPGISVKTDPQLLRECLVALMINAIQYTKKGSLNIIFSSTQDSLNFDIVDTGCGIPAADHDRIFQAYEKCDLHSRGAGLGLTVASKIAYVINGEVSLVSSHPGVGSHFRASFTDLSFETSQAMDGLMATALTNLPKQYYTIASHFEDSPLIQPFANFLEHRGLTRAASRKDALIVLDYTADAKYLEEHLLTTSSDQVVLCLLPAGASSTTLDEVVKLRKTLFCAGPFLTSRMDDLLMQANNIYRSMSRVPSPTELSAPFTLSVPPIELSRSYTPPRNDLGRFKDSLPSALLVDDNPVNLHILRVYCERRGIPYVVALDGNEAVEAFTSSQVKNPINLVLMDLQMPCCDGLEATTRIRQLEAAASASASAIDRRPVVIFMVTGQDSAEDRRRAEAAGTDDFYVKPVGIKTLDKAIKGYFSNFTPAAGGAVKQWRKSKSPAGVMGPR